ncbi:T9SS-dependent M36 family metallopeptidase [Chryseobacterium sp. S90]|uniref:T9SS-dependent M36 family metallopeptidase n=1 Tax=Chryseobacterium sp. S90 TaxID=3395373 RepID=UPI0039BCD99B
MEKKKLPLLLYAVLLFLSNDLFSQNNEDLIRSYISSNKLKEFKKTDLANFIIENVDRSKSLNGSVVKFRQVYNGIPIYSSVGTVFIRDNNILYYTDNFIKDYQGSVSEPRKITDKKSILQTIADTFKKPEIRNYTLLGFYDSSSGSNNIVRERQVYAIHNNTLIACHELLMSEPGTSNYWNILVDADKGNIISKINLASYCNFNTDAYSHDFAGSKNKSFVFNELQYQWSNLWTPDHASYNVFKLPVEAPTFGNRTLTNDPWILTASPEGWHSDGTNHYTITKGNNVYAYVRNEIADYSPDGGTSRIFDYPFNINGTSLDNRDAAITNLFYLNNKVHDIFYQFGFTESARNFQQNNFSNGGIGNDYVLAEAQSDEGMNNAVFFPTPDGIKPTMKMFLWSPIKKLYYNTPPQATTRVPIAKAASFGPVLNNIGVTGDIQSVPVANGCTALSAGSLTNKIALIKGLTMSEIQQNPPCTFTTKVKNIQNAGAIGAIIYEDPAFENIGFFGDDNTITIPSVLIKNSEGEYIKNLLQAGTTVNITLKSGTGDTAPDGSFDSGIMSHEFGHGVSNRLTGTGYNCLETSESQEQMGEGWSDFFALMLTNTQNSSASVPRGLGTYIIGEPTTGNGGRPARYSPDFAINNYTYGDTNGMPDGHSIGFVWATMLWDLHWKYVEKYGYSADLTANTTNGSTRVMQLVMDALKLQACNPTFIDGRDAILAADQATTGGIDKCMIWKAFAKRGLGVNASAGSKTDINDQTEDFTVPSVCNSLESKESNVSKTGITLYPNPAKNEFFINFSDHILGKVNIEIFDMSGKLMYTENKVPPDTKKAISTMGWENGTYMITIKGLGFETVHKVIVNK